MPTPEYHQKQNGLENLETIGKILKHVIHKEEIEENHITQEEWTTSVKIRDDGSIVIDPHGVSVSGTESREKTAQMLHKHLNEVVVRENQADFELEPEED